MKRRTTDQIRYFMVVLWHSYASMTSVNLVPLKFNTTLRFYTLGGIFWRQLFSARGIFFKSTFLGQAKILNVFRQKLFELKISSDLSSREVFKKIFIEAKISWRINFTFGRDFDRGLAEDLSGKQPVFDMKKRK